MKLLYMWGLYPVIPERDILVLNFISVLSLGLSIAALFRFREHIRLLARFWVLPVYVSAIAMVSWGSWRFREVGDHSSSAAFVGPAEPPVPEGWVIYR